MAEAFLFNIAVSVVKQASGSLGSRVLKDLGLLSGVKGELEKLENTVSAIQAGLLDAEDKQAGNNAVKHWLESLTDVVYEADDLLDDFSTEGLLREMITQGRKKTEQVRIFFSKSNQLAYSLKMGREIKKIKEKLDAIEADPMAFEKGEEPENSRIVAIGKEILEKCRGVPLAIRIIGRLLNMRNSETEWFSFKSNELVRIKQNDILSTLKLSYVKLPPHLNHCFAYCSLFPKDCHIPKSILVKLWVAQGFIHLSDQDQSFEDVGNEYFLDLLWRPFFQEAELDEYGDVISCKMHDLMDDLAVSVTLRLNRCHVLRELHKDMKSLVNLRHLEIEECLRLTHMPCEMGQMTSLQTLTNFVLSLGSVSVDSGGLNKLKRLNNLRGNLVIEGLRHGKDAELEYKAADLREKQYLQSLHLKWDEVSAFKKDVVVEEMLWEVLQPHPNLKKLTLTYYQGVRFPNWLLLLTNLVELKLEKCENLQYLPPLSPLPSLRSLSSTVQPLIPSLHRLSCWIVYNCPMLTSTPTFSHPEETVYLFDAIWKLVQQTMIRYVAAPQCPSTAIASSFNPLTKLKRLQLNEIADLQSVQEEGLRNLIGLKYLSLQHCDRLQSLSSIYLTALQEPDLSYCNELDLGTLSLKFITGSEALQCLQKRNDKDVEEEKEEIGEDIEEGQIDGDNEGHESKRQKSITRGE
ncbi:putative disease resistance protein RGA1 [Morella rubra]|uniref:Putative disease resistance protein RGA1 n=1 Tax=Morella rubra TaxID=262757 RepID=A0A6A1WMX4_9ROSI|nr:putative disease resistance protein RGA1 [Morella rubra]